MKIRHLRNATLLLSIAEHQLLVDPMLSPPGAFPGFKVVGGGRRRNPLVPLPADALESIEAATGVLITHEHPDHLDTPAIQWIKARRLPVWASEIDAPNLKRKGLDARVLQNGDLGLSVEIVPARHGHGLIGWLMGPVSGFYLAHPDEPSVYITGDSVMTPPIRDAIKRLKPELIIAPAGSANFGFGRSILFPLDELLELAKLAPGNILFNHLEAIDHCPTTRESLRQRLDAEGIGERAFLPADGEWLEFHRSSTAPQPLPGPAIHRRPGVQKWLTAKFSGT
jgi:L-ascorbate metabolism protein UlaG (beta-lactamase superfamily)